MAVSSVVPRFNPVNRFNPGVTKKASSIHFREDEINKKEKNQPEDFV